MWDSRERPQTAEWADDLAPSLPLLAGSAAQINLGLNWIRLVGRELCAVRDERRKPSDYPHAADCRRCFEEPKRGSTWAPHADV
jgi:hypothetical protein